MRLTLNAGLKLAEAKICEKYSQTWSGRCTKTSHCDRQCINWEDARHGACHQDKHGRACFCYFNCKKNKTLKNKIIQTSSFFSTQKGYN
ncbi:hypothetical protein YC2023_080161 [Brassica napus]